MAGHGHLSRYATVRERLEHYSMPEPMSGCWLWVGGLNNKGYPKMGLHSKIVLAHRIAFEEFRGPIPDGLVLDHLCRTPVCINPWHLEAVTQRVNILRGVSPSVRYAKRTHCEKGHEFTPENTAYPKVGARRCKTCSRLKYVRRGPRTYWARKTHCTRGHEFNEANTYTWHGSRRCRICTREYQARRKAGAR